MSPLNNNVEKQQRGSKATVKAHDLSQNNSKKARWQKRANSVESDGPTAEVQEEAAEFTNEEKRVEVEASYQVGCASMTRDESDMVNFRPGETQ